MLKSTHLQKKEEIQSAHFHTFFSISRPSLKAAIICLTLEKSFQYSFQIFNFLKLQPGFFVCVLIWPMLFAIHHS